MKKLILLMSVSMATYGASYEDGVHVVNVKHVNSDGIQGTYIFKDVKGTEDLAARVRIIQESAPDLNWKLYYSEKKEMAYLVSYKKDESK